MTRRPPVVVEVPDRGRLYVYGVTVADVERRVQQARDRGQPRVNLAGEGSTWVAVDDVVAVRDGISARRLRPETPCPVCGVPKALRVRADGAVGCVRDCRPDAVAAALHRPFPTTHERTI
jgi:hypothetical protein